MKLEGAIVLVTGATRDIGAEFVKLLAKRGVAGLHEIETGVQEVADDLARS